MKTQDYRDYLKTELAERCKANPSYSLRSFARDLQLSPSRLSRILNAKEGLSEKSALSIATRLGLSASEAKVFTTLVQLSDSRSKQKRVEAKGELQGLENTISSTIDTEVFKIISDWYHFALMELTDTRTFKSSADWIAKRLGISVHEVRQAIKRLKELELLEEENGKLKQTEVNLRTTSGIPSTAIKVFTKQIFEKAIKAIDLQNIEERHFGTLTVSIDPEDVPYVAKRIQEFKDEINSYAEKTKKRKKKSEVYNLALGFFRLTEKE